MGEVSVGLSYRKVSNMELMSSKGKEETMTYCIK